ncbi:unnamed protein product [Didymodactylos carnosus]|uniref:Large ribosomal subunit protein mL45 n=1 Tax=Didymodactylos carnosus TaxID=1234261 RepID=A0A8S2GF67_9BILA|nr:unnamed protein product [Didymodactylos carnosus]CAF3510270.1 unnamed protein product [Didymodactylos carnosus]
MSLSTIVCRLFQLSTNHVLRVIPENIGIINTKRTWYTATKNDHPEPKWRPLRRAKILDIDLPDFDKERRLRRASIQEQREQFKKEGIPPIRSAEYRPIYLDASAEVLEAYVPPEGDAFVSLKKSVSSRKHSSTIKKYEPDFEPILFADIAQQRYIEAHQALMDRDEERMLQYATPKAFVDMSSGLRYKTLRWKWVEEIEPAYVVAIRSGDMLKGMTIAQVTVRMHSKQTCAIYDRFGRLMFGSETLPKDVLEYVVFEKLLTNPYGIWRVHSKITPNWLPPSDPLLYTFEKPLLKPVDDSIEDISQKQKVKVAGEQEKPTTSMPSQGDQVTSIPTLTTITTPPKVKVVGY